MLLEVRRQHREPSTPVDSPKMGKKREKVPGFSVKSPQIEVDSYIEEFSRKSSVNGEYGFDRHEQRNPRK